MTPSNWKDIYGTGANQNQGIPMSKNYDTNLGNFRDFYIHWSDLMNTSGISNCPLYSIYCDTLEIDNDITVDAALFIYARRIVATSGTNIVLSRLSGNYVPFSILTQEIVDTNGNASTLNILAVDDAGNTTSNNIKANGQESGLYWPMENATATPYLASNLDLTQFYYGQPLQLSLMSIFSLATVVFTTDSDIAIKQLQWISNLGRFGKDTLLLAADSNTFGSTLAAKRAIPSSAILVPYLDLSIYNNKAKAALDYLQSQQTAYDNIQAEVGNLKQWSANAEDMIQVSSIEATLNKNLEIQAQQTYEQAQYARKLAGEEIVIENNELFGLKINFDRGVKNWKIKQQTKDALDMVSGVVEILAQIPTIVAAGPEMAVLPAVQTAAGLATSAANIANAIGSKLAAKASDFSSPRRKPNQSDNSPGDIEMTEINPSSSSLSSSASSSTDESSSSTGEKSETNQEKAAQTQEKLVAAGEKIGQGAKEVVDSAMKIYEISRTSEELQNEGDEALYLANSAVTKTFQSINLTGINVITGGKQYWDNFKKDIELMFQKIDRYNIGGASEYKSGLLKLVVAGKSYCDAQVAVAKASTDLASAKMRVQAAEEKLKVFQKRSATLKSEITSDEVTGILLYTKLLDAKRSVYLAFDSYLRAAEYFTLRPENTFPPMPLMSSKVDVFAQAIAQIGGNELVLSLLNPTPQNMGISNKGGINITLNDPQILEQLKSTSSANWQIKTDNPNFNGFGRVRLDLVRIYLLGITTTDNIMIQIVTTGVYNDINPSGGLPNLFVGAPMRINFVYSGSPDNPNIRFDGQVPVHYQNDFFQPTPFSSWTISISNQSGGSIDLSQLTGILIQLGGEATSI